jgi:hypothetical protein
MNNVAGALVMGTQSGCEADFYMISVEELLKINSIQVSIV